jgi:3-oxoacyl-[acyl-carrier protein] reductase
VCAPPGTDDTYFPPAVESPDMLDGQTCLVTGASRGIGRGIAKELGEHGADVVVNYRSSEGEAHAVCDHIEDECDGRALPAQADVADMDDVEAMAEAVREEWGSIDVLVNNAGITVDKKFEQMTREDWERVVHVNLGGVFNCTKACFEDLCEADEGRLINISSVVGQQGNYGQANYATTKAGLFGFTRTLALEMASTGSTANCVAPGFVKTDMLETVPERVKERILDRIPLNRFATVDDVAGIVRFVASEDASYMTGQILAVNGGMEW